MDHAFRWTSNKIAARLRLVRPLVHRDTIALEPLRYLALDDPEAPAPVGPDVDDSGWEVVEPHTYWGEQGTDFVFRTGFTVPRDWAPGPIALFLPMGVAGDIFTHPESLLHLDGEPIASADRHHHRIGVPEACRDGRRHAIALHGWTGLAGWPPDPTLRDRLFMRPCALVRIDEPTRDLVALAELALGAAEALDDDRPERHRLLNALDAAFLALDTRDPLRTPRFWDSVPGALETLRAGVRAAGAPLDVDVVAVGHAHMDIAYLWRTAQMRRKNARTYSNVLRLMAENPAYRYSHDQPQLYRWTEEDYPELFGRIRERVADGSWEPMGATWVEPDTNITGAESLVRQLTLGRRYYAEAFGDLAESAGRAPGERIDTPVLWLPDTFGFTWALPQLMRQAGVRWFLTSKVNWNQYNRMPAQNLLWQGIDGSRVLTHFLTTPRPVQHLPFPTTYKAEVTPAEALGSWTNFAQKHSGAELLMVYGYGDGGGGPTDDLVRKAALMGNVPGMPRVRMGTVREFFENLEAAGTERLPVWNDELYMEGHRGVLTTHGDIKRANRRGERLLHRAELVAATASAVAGHPYPHEALREAWELLCLNQFHDILPGTAIPEVFVDAHRDYARVRRIGDEVLGAALGALGAVDAAAADATGTTGPGAVRADRTERWLVVNAAPFEGDPVVMLEREGAGGRLAIDAPALVDADRDVALRHQDVEGGRLLEPTRAPAGSIAALRLRAGDAQVPHDGRADRPDGDEARARRTGGGHALENAHLLVEFDERARLVRVLDKRARREALVAGRPANELQAFEDRPLNWDAWDVDAFFEDRLELVDGLVEARVVEDGPLRACLRIERTVGASRIVQRVRLRAGSPRLDFVTSVDWRETHTLLKVAFPVAVLAPRATYEIQWGSIERPTHRNTSWDAARFEVAAQQWVDLSEGDYGVALLNDCKYGHDVRDDVIRLSLIKCATSPDPTSDQGGHEFTYSLLPHAGDWREGVIAEARRLNDPAFLVPAHAGASRRDPLAHGALAPVTSEARNAVIETVKLADDGDGLIVRLYESERRRGPVRLRLGIAVASVVRCDLHEDDIGPLEIEADGLVLDLAPFEIASLRVRPVRSGPFQPPLRHRNATVAGNPSRAAAPTRSGV